MSTKIVNLSSYSLSYMGDNNDNKMQNFVFFKIIKTLAQNFPQIFGLNSFSVYSQVCLLLL